VPLKIFASSKRCNERTTFESAGIVREREHAKERDRTFLLLKLAAKELNGRIPKA
jgi:hypothetical protein